MPVRTIEVHIRLFNYMLFVACAYFECFFKVNCCYVSVLHYHCLQLLFINNIEVSAAAAHFVYLSTASVSVCECIYVNVVITVVFFS